MVDSPSPVIWTVELAYPDQAEGGLVDEDGFCIRNASMNRTARSNPLSLFL